MRYRSFSLAEKWVIKGIPALFFIGSIMHLLYDLSGENPVVGIIAAVNESIWEHLKMVTLPVIFWFTIYYVVRGRKIDLDRNKWFTCSLASLFTALATIPFLYYFYTQAFGVEVLAIDIGILFLAVLFGQMLALHFYKHSKGINGYIPMAVFITVLLVFAIFTFYPPHLPIFKDSLTGGYGIQ